MTNVSIAQALSDAAGRVETLEVELKRVTEKHENATRVIAAMNSSYTTLSTKLTKVEQQFADYRTAAVRDYNDITKRLDTANELVRTRGSRINVLEESTESYRKKYEEAAAKIKALENPAPKPPFVYPKWSQPMSGDRILLGERLSSMTNRNIYVGDRCENVMNISALMRDLGLSPANFTSVMKTTGAFWLFQQKDSDGDDIYRVVVFTPEYSSEVTPFTLSLDGGDYATWVEPTTPQTYFTTKEEAMEHLCNYLRKWAVTPALQVALKVEPKPTASTSSADWWTGNQVGSYASIEAGRVSQCNQRFGCTLGRGQLHLIGVGVDVVPTDANTSGRAYLYKNSRGRFDVLVWTGCGRYGERPYYIEKSYSGDLNLVPFSKCNWDGDYSEFSTMGEAAAALKTIIQQLNNRGTKLEGFDAPIGGFASQFNTDGTRLGAAQAVQDTEPAPSATGGMVWRDSHFTDNAIFQNFERPRLVVANSRFGGTHGQGQFTFITTTARSLPSQLGVHPFAMLYRSGDRYDVIVWTNRTGQVSRPYYLDAGRWVAYDKSLWSSAWGTFPSKERALEALNKTLAGVAGRTALQGWDDAPTPVPVQVAMTQRPVEPVLDTNLWETNGWHDAPDAKRIANANCVHKCTFRGKIIATSRGWIPTKAKTTGLVRLVEFTLSDGTKQYDLMVWAGDPERENNRPYLVNIVGSVYPYTNSWDYQTGCFQTAAKAGEVLTKFLRGMNDLREPITLFKDWEGSDALHCLSSSLVKPDPTHWYGGGTESCDAACINAANAHFGEDFTGTIIANGRAILSSRRNTSGSARLVRHVNDNVTTYDVLYWATRGAGCSTRPYYLGQDGMANHYGSWSWGLGSGEFKTLDEALKAKQIFEAGAQVLIPEYPPAPNTTHTLPDANWADVSNYMKTEDATRISEATTNIGSALSGTIVAVSHDELPSELHTTGQARLLKRIDAQGDITYEVLIWGGKQGTRRPYVLCSRGTTPTYVAQTGQLLWSYKRGLFKTPQEAANALKKYINDLKGSPIVPLAGW